ncbi:MAG: ABC transporter permease [Butyrivibrio sp.]|nr:ABC transporter permease [Butyrivibrio sp.]
MNGLKTIISKELRRVFTDRKLIFSMFILPAIVVIGIMYLTSTLMNNMQDKVKEHVSEIVVYQAPEDFVQIAGDTEGINVKYISEASRLDTAKEQIRSGVIDYVVCFPDGFEKAVADKNGLVVPEIKTYYNPSEDTSAQAKSNFAPVIEAYRSKLMADRFGSAEKAVIFTVDSTNPQESSLVDEEKASGKAMGSFIPYFITMIIFAGAMGLGVDSIAGEKERGTITSLLLAPVKRVNIVMGKIISLSILSVLSAIIYMGSMIIAFPMMMSAEGATSQLGGLNLSLDAVQILQLVVVVIGAVLLYVTIIGIVSVLSRTIKEAQTYITPVYMIIIVAGLVTMFSSDSNNMLFYGIPLVNIAASLRGILTNDLTWMQWLLTVGVTYGMTFILMAAIAKAFKSEKIMFNA